MVIDFLKNKIRKNRKSQSKVTIKTTIIKPQQDIARLPTESDFSDYNFNNINSINSISVPTEFSSNNEKSFYNNLNYVLQKKATQHKRENNLDLAIACLYKTNEIMAKLGCGTPKDYLRLIEFLECSGRFTEADSEKKRLENTLPHVFNPTFSNKNLANCTEDLVIFSGSRLCPLCSIYNQRVYSRLGRNTNFPSFSFFPIELTATKCPVCNSALGFSNYYNNIIDKKDLKEKIHYSNSPAIDKRTSEEKQLFENIQKEKQQKEQAETEYKWIRRYLPDIAPKSLSGYSKMKNSNSTNFQKLKKQALIKGFVIE